MAVAARRVPWWAKTRPVVNAGKLDVVLLRTEPGSPFLIAASCFWPTSVTNSGGTGSFGALSNSSVINALGEQQQRDGFGSVRGGTGHHGSAGADRRRLWCSPGDCAARCRD